MPKETSEQIVVARWLRAHGVLFFHVPNGMWRDRRQAVVLRAMGVQAGVPDLLVMDPPPAGGAVGAAIEMKSAAGRTTPVQERWLEQLAARGWATRVCWGAEAAIAFLKSLGYGG